MSADLSAEALVDALPGRPLRVYPVVVSTESDAMAWARSGAAEGSMVVAGQQVAPRSRPRRPWPSAVEDAVSFTLIVRPDMPPIRGGVLHLVTTAGIADLFGAQAEIEWPDEVYLGDRRVGLVSVHLEQTVRGLEWALINVLLTDAPPPRAAVVARAVEAIERRYHQPAAELVTDWTPRCRTIGRTVTALLYPIGREQAVTGRAISVSTAGALTIEDASGRRRGVRPYELAAWAD